MKTVCRVCAGRCALEEYREATSPELLLRPAGAARNHLEYVRVGNC